MRRMQTETNDPVTDILTLHKLEMQTGAPPADVFAGPLSPSIINVYRRPLDKLGQTVSVTTLLRVGGKVWVLRSVELALNTLLSAGHTVHEIPLPGRGE